MHLLPALPAIDTALEVGALNMEADECALVTHDDSAFRNRSR